MGKKSLIVLLSLFLGIGVTFAQSISVRGTVTDATTGEGIPFASVVLQGTMTGTSTDADGNYVIDVPSNGVLVFSSIGYKEFLEAVNGRNVHHIALSPDSESLQETIVVAFGTTTKEAFTGSASVMKADDLQKRATTNVTNALVGSVPGLQIRGASGAPGAGSGSMNIRGISSMYASTDPLVIVDGAPYSASLSNIPQSDIESVTVLKDAASAALYGARGASGVILVTTKRSRTRDAQVNVDAKWGISSRAIQDYETITDPGEYYEAYYAQRFNQYYYGLGQSLAEANVNANRQMITDLGYNVYTVPEGEQLIGQDGKLNPKAVLGRSYEAGGETYYVQPDDWQKAAYKSAARKEYNVSVNGTHDKGTFYASFGYLNEDGIIEYSGFERLTARAKADYQAKKWLRLNANVSYTHSNTESNPNMGSTYGSTNLLYYTSMIAPIYPIYVRVLDGKTPVIRTDEFGNEQYDYGVASTNYPNMNRAFLQTGNPLGSNRFNSHWTKGNQFNGTLSADFDITDHLKANISATETWGNTMYSHYENPFYGPKVGVNGEITKYQSNTLRSNLIQTVTYANSFGNHNINALVGHEYYDTKTYYLEAVANGGFSPEMQEIDAFATKTDSSSYTTEYNVEGYFFSAQYNYYNKYFASASFRRDASSRFAKTDSKDHRWGNFWSLGGAWIVNKEPFMQSQTWIDQLKLKASIGQQGNDGIGNFRYVDMYSLSKSSATTMAPSFSLLGNEDLTWETTTNFNAGAEFSFFGGRLSGDVEGYYKRTDDLLFWLSIPESAGTRGYYGNIGDIANYGVELSLNGTIIRTKTVDWSVAVNASHNRTRILSLPPDKTRDNGGFFESPFWYEEGGPLNNYMTYSYAGVNEYGEALYWYDEELSPAGGKVSSNNIAKPGTTKSGTTTVIGEASRYTVGSTMPKLFGGFSTTLRVGDFDLNATFDYQIGGKIYDSRYASLMSPLSNASSAGSTFHKDWIRSWSPVNTDSDIPRWQFGDAYATYSSDRFLTNASYLNFQSVSVGYNVPVARLGLNRYINRIRVYGVAENLGFISARKGLDPRQSFSSASSLNVYSPVRTISGGVQLTF